MKTSHHDARQPDCQARVSGAPALLLQQHVPASPAARDRCPRPVGPLRGGCSPPGFYSRRRGALAATASHRPPPTCLPAEHSREAGRGRRPARRLPQRRFLLCQEPRRPRGSDRRSAGGGSPVVCPPGACCHCCPVCLCWGLPPPHLYRLPMPRPVPMPMPVPRPPLHRHILLACLPARPPVCLPARLPARLQEAAKREVALSPATHYRGWQRLGANVTRFEGGFQRDWHEGLDLYKVRLSSVFSSFLLSGLVRLVLITALGGHWVAIGWPLGGIGSAGTPNQTAQHAYSRDQHSPSNSHAAPLPLHLPPSSASAAGDVLQEVDVEARRAAGLPVSPIHGTNPWPQVRRPSPHRLLVPPRRCPVSVPVVAAAELLAAHCQCCPTATHRCPPACLPASAARQRCPTATHRCLHACIPACPRACCCRTPPSSSCCAATSPPAWGWGPPCFGASPWACSFQRTTLEGMWQVCGLRGWALCGCGMAGGRAGVRCVCSIAGAAAAGNGWACLLASPTRRAFERACSAPLHPLLPAGDSYWVLRTIYYPPLPLAPPGQRGGSSAQAPAPAAAAAGAEVERSVQLSCGEHTGGRVAGGMAGRLVGWLARAS